MKKALVCLSAFFVFGCSADDSANETAMIPGLEYYRFTSEDNSRLLNSSLDKGRTIGFKNQLGQEIHYKVVSRYKGRADDNTGTFSGGGIPSHYFDRQSVTLESVEFANSANSGISIVVYKPSASALMADVYFDRWMEGGYWAKENLVISNVSPQAATFNGKTYSKVVTVNAHSATSQTADGFPLNATKIHYDFNYGIIGFDDLEGNEWRRN